MVSLFSRDFLKCVRIRVPVQWGSYHNTGPYMNLSVLGKVFSAKSRIGLRGYGLLIIKSPRAKNMDVHSTGWIRTTPGSRDIHPKVSRSNTITRV